MDLGTLYARMTDGRADWEGLPWDTPPERDAEGLLPEAWTKLTMPQSWPKLNDEERVRLRQLQLAGETESLIHAEHLFVQAARVILGSISPSSPGALALAKFIEEECNHLQQFERYLRARLPEMYPAGATFTYRFKSPALLATLMATACELARRCPASVFVLIEYFEIITIQLHRFFASHPQGGDPLFLGLHRAHAIEEGRHVALDRELVFGDTLPPQSASRLSWSAFGLFAAMGLVEQDSYRRVLQQLLKEHPRLEACREVILSDADLSAPSPVMRRSLHRFQTTYRAIEPRYARGLFRRVLMRGLTPEACAAS